MANTDSFCPYCASVLDRPPKRAARCPHCERVVHIRSKQTLFPTHLLRVDQKLAWDTFANLRSNHGATEADFRQVEAEMSSVFRKPAPPLDVIMGLFDLLALRGTTRLSTLYRSQALFVAARGHDPRPWLQQSMRMQVELEFRPSPVVGGVQVRASYTCCDECQVQNGDEYTIEEALKVMPVPFEGCTRKVYDSPYAFCMCMYTTVLKPASEWG